MKVDNHWMTLEEDLERAQKIAMDPVLFMANGMMMLILINFLERFLQKFIHSLKDFFVLNSIIEKS